MPDPFSIGRETTRCFSCLWRCGPDTFRAGSWSGAFTSSRVEFVYSCTNFVETDYARSKGSATGLFEGAARALWIRLNRHNGNAALLRDGSTTPTDRIIEEG